jgi:hypothetical protein
MLSTTFDQKNNKLRFESLKVSKQHIKSFLEKRYDAHQVEAIMAVIKFPSINTYEDHWRHLDKFIAGDIKQKKRLGFMMHDLNEDGRICPNDLFDFVTRLRPTDTLISNDVFQIVKGLQRKLVSDSKPDGYLLKQLQEEFTRLYNKQ